MGIAFSPFYLPNHTDSTLLPTPTTAPEPDDTYEAEIEERDISEEKDEDLEVDDDKDCDFRHTLVGRRFKGLYLLEQNVF